MRPLLIGVAGGSGSGKTTVVRELVRGIGSDAVAVVHHDAYYRDAVALPDGAPRIRNYDHPDALETSLLVAHLVALREGRAVDAPVYDFTTSSRLAETQRITPRRTIVLDGILILAEETLRELLDIKVYVDADADVRLMRRLRRDVQERGRSVESVLDQYARTVRPMHLEFVEPSKRYADIIVPGGGHNRVAIDMLVARVRASLSDSRDWRSEPVRAAAQWTSTGVPTPTES